MPKPVWEKADITFFTITASILHTKSVSVKNSARRKKKQKKNGAFSRLIRSPDELIFRAFSYII